MAVHRAQEAAAVAFSSFRAVLASIFSLEPCEVGGLKGLRYPARFHGKVWIQTWFS